MGQILLLNGADGILMPHYRVTLESESELQYVNVNDCEGLSHARQDRAEALGEFKEWRCYQHHRRAGPAAA